MADGALTDAAPAGGGVEVPALPPEVAPPNVLSPVAAEPRHRWGAPLRVHGRQAGPGPRWVGRLGGLLVLGAGVMTAVGSGMTWGTIRVPGLMDMVVRGTDFDQYGQTTSVLGMLSMVLGVLIAGRGRGGWEWILAASIGAMIIVAVLVDLARLHNDTLLGGLDLGVSVDVGAGLWLTLAGGVLALTGALLVRMFGAGRRV